MLEVILDGFIDTLKLIPYLLVTFILLECIEHKLNNKNYKLLSENRKFGPVIGSVLGAIPQCGFSSMSSSLFSSRVITIGTLVSVFLSTSDEMIPIMISENVSIMLLLKIIGFKILVGVIVGIIVDILFKQRENNNHIHEMCKEDNCSCDKDGIIISSIKHTLKIGLFILTANVLIDITIEILGKTV